MKTAAMVLGIVGGVIGIIAALAAMFIGGIGSAFEAEGGTEVIVLGFVAFFIAVAAIVGGALAHRTPTASWVILLATGILGFLAISAAWILSGVLLIIGGILQFVAARRESRMVKPGGAAS